MKVKNLIRLLALQDLEAEVHLLYPGTPVANVEEVHRPADTSVVVLLSPAADYYRRKEHDVG